MILTDYLRCGKSIEWDFAKQCGVDYGVIRLPEDKKFDITEKSHWEDIYKRFTDFGIKPEGIEPLPNNLHDHIKNGDEKRDESIEKAIKMLEFMNEYDIRVLCFNFMAHIGWTRTSSKIKERGGALVTGFDINDFKVTDDKISAKELWDNYWYFIKAVLPYAEKYNIRLALHPDDPPLEKLGNVERIMINLKNIEKAIGTVKSDCLGLTFCQATYKMMGEDIYSLIPKLASKIFFVHFRNASGNKLCFRETFHDNGDIDMKRAIELYKRYTPNALIRVDHVPQMAGEGKTIAGYGALGRLFAIGYLRGLMQDSE